MNNENNRLKTFSKWPTDAPVSPEHLARAGFYYDGFDLEVECFFCNVRINDWNYGDHAIVRHRRASLRCPFVLNPSRTSNVPSISSSNDNGRLLPLEPRPISISGSCPLSLSIEELNRDYGTVQQRLDTFNNSSISEIISPQRLAESGFFYLGEGHSVGCVFCQGIINQWRPGADPDREHRIHFPRCNFYLSQNNSDANNEIIQLSDINLISASATNYEDLGIQTLTPPINPKYSSYESRLRTFCHWSMDLSQTPETLAKAGFYSVGFEDHVRCFHCDGGLHSWLRTDDPWEEHAKWFPRCGFLNFLKTVSFINQCVENRPSPEGIIEENSNHHEHVFPISQPDTSIGHPIDIPELEDNTVTVVEENQDNSVTETLSETESPSANDLPSTSQLSDTTQSLTATEQNILSSNNPESHQIDEDFFKTILDKICRAAGAMQISQNKDKISSSQELKQRLEKILEDFDWQNAIEQHTNLSPTTEVSDSNDKPIKKETNTETEKSSTSLEEENRILKEARQCKICLDREIAVVFLPCGHLAACLYCTTTLECCPICRQLIHATVRTFFS